jgi:hypothetical protein
VACCPPVLSAAEFILGVPGNDPAWNLGQPGFAQWTGALDGIHNLFLSVDKKTFPLQFADLAVFENPNYAPNSGAAPTIPSIASFTAFGQTVGIGLGFDFTGGANGDVWWIQIANPCGCCTGFAIEIFTA